MNEWELDRQFDEIRDTLAFHRHRVLLGLMWVPIAAPIIAWVLANLGVELFRHGRAYYPYADWATVSLIVAPGSLVSYYLLYRRRRTQIRERMQAIIDRAVPVDCTVGETHVINIAYGYYNNARKYYPAVEFEYERDGTTHQSLYVHPDGFTHGTGNLHRAERRAREAASDADGTAFYDPETEQAFLSDDLQTRGLGQWSGLLMLYWIAAVAGSLWLSLVLVFTAP